MNVRGLKELLSILPDNFVFQVEVQKDIPKEELSKRAYPYPTDSQICEVEKDSYDIAWSDNKLKLIVKIKDSNW